MNLVCRRLVNVLPIRFKLIAKSCMRPAFIHLSRISTGAYFFFFTSMQTNRSLRDCTRVFVCVCVRTTAYINERTAFSVLKRAIKCYFFSFFGAGVRWFSSKD